MGCGLGGKHPYWEKILRIPAPVVFTVMINIRVIVQMQLGGICNDDVIYAGVYTPVIQQTFAK